MLRDAPTQWEHDGVDDVRVICRPLPEPRQFERERTREEVGHEELTTHSWGL